MILSIGFSWYIGWKLKKKFKEYSEITLAQNLSGKDVAEKMLRDSGITDVSVISVEGELTDHYNPMNKTVNLSPDVYYGRNVSAAAVAAHECGHAIQHAHSYAWLTMRSKLVPLQNVSAKVINTIFIVDVYWFILYPRFISDSITSNHTLLFHIYGICIYYLACRN